MNVRLDRQNPYLRIDAVNVYVKDQDRSLHFYLDQLGFDLALDTQLQSGHRLVAVAPPDGTTVLRLIAPDPDSEDYQLIGRRTPIVFLTVGDTVENRAQSSLNGGNDFIVKPFNVRELALKAVTWACRRQFSLLS